MNWCKYTCYCGLVTLALIGIADQARTHADEAKDSVMVYELRTYTTNPGKLEALHARFRDHTMRIFDKHGMKNIAYWTPVDKPDTLVYIIAHRSREAADQSWAAFKKDPEWQAAYKEFTKEGALVKNVESQYLKATNYSPMK